MHELKEIQRKHKIGGKKHNKKIIKRKISKKAQTWKKKE
jgi:hypothetical protein